MPSLIPRWLRPGLARRAWRYFQDPRVALWRRLTGVLAVVYTVWPLDALPDAIPLVGWLDDLGVLGAASWFLLRDIQRHAEREAPEQDARGGPS